MLGVEIDSQASVSLLLLLIARPMQQLCSKNCHGVFYRPHFAIYIVHFLLHFSEASINFLKCFHCFPPVQTFTLKVKHFQCFPFYNYSYNQMKDTTIKLCTNNSQEKYASSLGQDYEILYMHTFWYSTSFPIGRSTSINTLISINMQLFASGKKLFARPGFLWCRGWMWAQSNQRTRFFDLVVLLGE